MSNTCPPDGFASAQTRCAQTTGAACDLDDYCTGTSLGCPDRLAGNGTVCRPSAGTCDIAETCSGMSPVCPNDVFLPNSSLSCAPGVCPGNGPTCVNTCTTNANCAQTPRSFCLSGTCRTGKFAFVSSTPFTSGMGPTGAQTICTNAGMALGGVYLPFLSTSSSGQNPAAAFPADGGPWIRRDKALIALSKADLLDGTLVNSISQNEFGNNFNIGVWTGTSPSGNPANHCANWSSSNSSGTFGSSDQSGSRWAQETTQLVCNSALSVYCFQAD